MAQKFLYIVDHFVIAEHDDECFDLITEVDNEDYKECYVNLRNNIVKAPRFALADAVESEVIDRFIT
jgi:hypothetical protein